MRILHTADLHLGRQFNGISLDEDHQAALDQIEAAVRQYAVDVLVIAGDIFDRAAPPASAAAFSQEDMATMARDPSPMAPRRPARDRDVRIAGKSRIM